MNVGILGLGSIGMRHARNYRHAGATVSVGMDPSPERRSGFADEIGGEGVATLDEVLAHPPDLMVVASPNVFHVAQARACVAAGCHLFIEKPLGTSMDGVAELAAVVREAGLFAHVGSNFKFHRAFQEMKRILDSGALGRVTGAQVLAGQWLPDWHPWEDYRQGYSARSDLGGGIVLDTHEFDYLLWLLGPVAEARGICRRTGSLEVETEDVAGAVLAFEQGALATVQVDYIQRSYRRRYHVSGDAGSMEWDFTTGRLEVYAAGPDPVETLDVSEDVNAMYLSQARHTLEGVAGRVPPVTTIEHAATVLELQLDLRNQRV